MVGVDMESSCGVSSLLPGPPVTDLAHTPGPGHWQQPAGQEDGPDGARWPVAPGAGRGPSCGRPSFGPHSEEGWRVGRLLKPEGDGRPPTRPHQ
ncbi:hypothetical protein San01_20870 [Streptomyces angustmyceticus]|uniref:Uncharacterized protein n=1 Tax=Streptomyces angustmyceticus TaxID=285578 RepID=A0A5J4LDK4_9ACTN|nr:hypothetical protein San01_20870 [Streptomyces angustmyceticus]